MRALLSAAALLILAGCSSPTVSDNPAGDQNAVVVVTEYNFSPTTRNVLQGSVVEWNNTGAERHSVTASDGSFDEDLESGETWTRTFGETGTYDYHCKYHPRMTGKVTVTAKASTSGTTTA